MDLSRTGQPRGLRWRSSTPYILITIGIAMFTDLFLYGIVVPIIPFILESRLHLPHSSIQSSTSVLLSAFAFASLLFSLPAGIVADRLPSRQLPFLAGLAALFGATMLLWLGQSFGVLVLARVLQGVSGAVVWTVGLALMIDTVGSKNLGTALGSIFSIISTGELIAPVVGGVVYEKAGSGAVFGIAFALLAVDFVMRLVVVEKKVAARYGLQTESVERTAASDEGGEGEGLGGETSPLLPTLSKPSSAPPDSEAWSIPKDLPRIYHKFPLLYPLSHPRLLAALLLCFTQACLLGVYDATLPTEAQDLFAFNSLQAGLLFIPLILPSLILGPLFGRFVDRAGPKPAAVLGLLLLMPPLICLRIPHSVPAGSDPHAEVAKLVGILGTASIGMSMINSPGVVEASYVIERYEEANPGFFGSEGPYAQLYAVNSMCFSTGLMLGPLAAGALREKVGYGNMNACTAGLCGFVAVVCFAFLGGGVPRWVSRGFGKG